MDMEIYSTNADDNEDYEDYEETVGPKTRLTTVTPEQLRTRAGELQKELDDCKNRFNALEQRIKKLGCIIGFGMAILFLVLIGVLIFFMITSGHKLSAQEIKISECDTKIAVQDTKIREQDTKIKTQDTKIYQHSHFCGYQNDWFNKNGQVITYDKLLLQQNNVGSSFSKEEGKFTAGIDGVYHVDFNVGYMYTHVNDYENVDIYLRHNEKKLVESQLATKTSKNYYEIGGRSMLVKMAKGDRLDIYGFKISDIQQVTFCVGLQK